MPISVGARVWIRLIRDIGPLTVNDCSRAKRSNTGRSLDRLLHIQHRSVDCCLPGYDSQATPSAPGDRLYPTQSGTSGCWIDRPEADTEQNELQQRLDIDQRQFAFQVYGETDLLQPGAAFDLRRAHPR